MAPRDDSWLDTLFPKNADRTVPWGEVSDVVTLYRPIGLRELQLIAEDGYRAFPPRLPDQPIFYPVLNFAYAEEIARDWNAKTAPFVGFVTRFDVRADVATHYDIQVVGSERTHVELWVPAEELDAFNAAIVGHIHVGAAFEGEIDAETHVPRGWTVPPR